MPGDRVPTRRNGHLRPARTDLPLGPAGHTRRGTEQRRGRPMNAYSGRNPIAEAVRRATHTKTEKPPSAGQQILATVDIAGEQDLRLDTHGSGNRKDWGGHIAVSTDNLLIYLHDQIAARLYAE